MSDPKLTLDYEPPKPASRGKIWLVVGILVFAGLVLCTFVLSTVHVTRLTPPIAPMGPAYAPRSVTPVMPATAPATLPSN